jgi:4-amino-4-deoxy-L-arabinose transferase-like glycosyltransferase
MTRDPRFDRIALLSVVALAALLRLPGLATRGRFDADQGHDMFTLVAFVRDGVVPLLGPKTSVGEFHHGAAYYFLLAPAAAISNGDPVAVTAFLALLGIGAVTLTWWLARKIGGSVAGFVAGLLMAVSPAGIEQSTFIWNPNPIGFFAVLALAAAWRARTDERPAWWALAIGAAGMVVQLHVLGVVFLVALLGLGLLEVRRDRSVLWGVLSGLVVVALLFVPLLVHELQTGFEETRALLAYLRAGDEAGASPLGALAFTLLRVVGWPVIGLVTDAPALAAVVLAVTLGLVVMGLRLARDAEATGLRWLTGILIFSTVALAFAAPSLQRVVPGLPNDHYHAFLDAVVAILIAVPAARLLVNAMDAWRARRQPAALMAAVAVGAGLALLVTVASLRKPPVVDPDGGWDAARLAGDRIVEVTGAQPIHLIGLPDFKLPDAIGFPVARAGGRLVEDPGTAGIVVVACDRLFEGAIGAACNGPAEDQLMDDGTRWRDVVLLDRFPASPRTIVSVYAAAMPP